MWRSAFLSGCCVSLLLIAGSLGCARRGSALPAKRSHKSDGASTASVVAVSLQSPSKTKTPASPPAGPFRFVEVTERAGVHFLHHSPLTEQRHAHLVYGSGVCWLDVDRDGWPDLYCCQGATYRPGTSGEKQPPQADPSNVLYLNRQNGSFADVTGPAGLVEATYSMGVAAADYDNDGFPDLCVTGYGENVLYHNNGDDGRFVDLSAEAGITAEPARCGLGVVAADLDADGDVDFYVSNDMGPNFLWENQGHGKFVDRGLEAGVAFNRYGACEAGMSVEAADFSGSGRFDLFVTNFFHETNTFYRNEGNLLFSDVTPATGLGAPSKLRLCFGTVALDFDQDAFLDLLVVCGHVHDRLPEIGRDEPFAQLPLLFHNERGRRFSEVSAGTGGYFAEPHVGRGAAAADFDRDGDADVAVLHLNGPAALLSNDTAPAGAWLQLELVGTKNNRSGVGAVVTIDLGRQSLVRTRQAGSGYCSCGEERLLIGVRDAARVPRVTVRWPGGLQETWTDLAVNAFYRLAEGAGQE